MANIKSKTLKLDYFSYNSMCKKCTLSFCFWCEELIVRSDENYRDARVQDYDDYIKLNIHNECYEESLNQDH